MATDIHAEHVGSLLRQPWLLTARADYKDGKITQGELRAAEDRAAAENIGAQRSAGIRVFTDGEVRRTNWMTGILESIGGMSPVQTPAVTWHRPGGEVPPESETDFVMTAATSKPDARISSLGRVIIGTTSRRSALVLTRKAGTAQSGCRPAVPVH